MAANTKERIVEHSAELFRRQGYAGTGVKQIVAEASAPFGSVYHHFPGGKEQLGEEVIRWSGEVYGQLIDAFFVPGADPVSATRGFFAAAADTLRETDYAVRSARDSGGCAGGQTHRRSSEELFPDAQGCFRSRRCPGGPH